jgi:hypothetical protein
MKHAVLMSNLKWFRFEGGKLTMRVVLKYFAGVFSMGNDFGSHCFRGVFRLSGVDVQNLNMAYKQKLTVIK